MKETKKKKRNLGLWMVAGAFLVLLLVYLGIAVFFTSHFLPGTTINGVEASGKNVEAIEQHIER